MKKEKTGSLLLIDGDEIIVELNDGPEEAIALFTAFIVELCNKWGFTLENLFEIVDNVFQAVDEKAKIKVIIVKE